MRPDLLKNSQSSQPQSIFDGIVAVFIPNRDDLFITSPNSEYVPTFRSSSRGMFLMSDGSFGTDDPINKPQTVSRRYVHLACISRKPRNPNDPWWNYKILFDKLHSAEIELIDTAPSPYINEPQVRVLHSYMTEVSQAVDYVIHVGSIYLIPILPRDDSYEGVHARIKNMVERLQLIRDRLINVTDSRRGTVYFFAELQHASLEILAWWTFYKDVKPEIDKPSSTAIAITPRFLHGAFTTDPSIAADLRKGAVPVWLIQESATFSGQVIKKIVEMQYDDDLPFSKIFMEQEPESIFAVDPFEIEMRYRAIRSHCDEVVAHPSRFQRSQAQPPHDIHPSSTPYLQGGHTGHQVDATIQASASTSRPAGRFIARRERLDGPANRFITHLKPTALDDADFEELSFPGAPLAIPHLLDIYQTIRRNTILEEPLSRTWRIDRGTAYPKIKNFGGRDEKALGRLLVWKEISEAWIHSLISGTDAGISFNAQQWRTALDSFLVVSRRRGTETNQRNSEIWGEIDKHFRVMSKHLPDVSWIKGYVENGLQDGSLVRTEIQTDLWEINELGFRVDFLLADRRLARITAGEISIQETHRRREFVLTRCCYGLGGNTGIFFADAAYARKGFADPDWRERRRFTQFFFNLIQSWRVDLPTELRTVHLEWHVMTEYDFKEKERKLWERYVQVFYDEFTRLPFIPRTLPASVVATLTPRPGRQHSA